MGGSMKEELMLDWCQKVFRTRGSFLCNEDSLLLMDSHVSHTKQSVKQELEKMNVKIKFVPAKTTSYLQPLDVGIKGPFKLHLREEWNDWFINGPVEFIPKGYRKRPSYEYLLKMVSNALKKITPDIIKRSLEACGVKANGQKVEVEALNGRLRGIFGLHEGVEEMQEEGAENSPGETSEEDEIVDENLDAELDILV